MLARWEEAQKLLSQHKIQVTRESGLLRETWLQVCSLHWPWKHTMIRSIGYRPVAVTESRDWDLSHPVMMMSWELCWTLLTMIVRRWRSEGKVVDDCLLVTHNSPLTATVHQWQGWVVSNSSAPLVQATHPAATPAPHNIMEKLRHNDRNQVLSSELVMTH